VAQFLPEQIPEGVESFEALAVWAVARLARMARGRTVGAGVNGAQVSAVSITRIEAADGRLYARVEAFLPLLLDRLNDPDEKSWMATGAVLGATDPVEAGPPPPPPPPPPCDPHWLMVWGMWSFDAPGGLSPVPSARGGGPLTLQRAASLDLLAPLVGTGSLRINGSKDAAVSSGPALYNFGAADFTVDVVHSPNLGTANSGIFNFDNILSVYQQGGTWRFTWSGYWDSGIAVVAGAPVLLSLVRSAGVVQLWVQGVPGAAQVAMGTFSASTFTVGWYQSNVYNGLGKYDQIRITIGVARNPAAYAADALTQPFYEVAC
jgi:hypothetical protein